MKKVTVSLSVEYGSAYQEDFFIRMLQVMLDALKIHMEQSHKDNKISYEIDTHDGFKITKK